MSQEPERDASLRAIQGAFASSIGAATVAGPGALDVESFLAPHEGIAAAHRIAVYRNNAQVFFRSALERTYPVLHRRIGDESFRQLAHEYRLVHPSRHGDLHWVGAAFPQWLAERLAATEYSWLAELARFEWACEEAAAASLEPPLPIACIAEVPPEQLERLRIAWQPSMRLFSSPFPIWSVWQSNQADDEAPPVDLEAGGECCAISCIEDRVAAYRLEHADFRLAQRLADGQSLGDAMAGAEVDAEVLVRLLTWAFSEQLVVGLSPSAPA